jgi:hypothetical protein
MVTLVNRAKVSTATTGTGTITLGSAESGYQTFADAGVVDADVVRYVIEDGTNWEIGTGTYTASGTTLTRTVLESSNADAAINLSGSAVVFVGAAAEDLAPVLELYAENPSSPTAPSATGTNAVAIGTNAQATNTNAVAITRNALASGLSSFAVGNNAAATGTNGIAIGSNTDAVERATAIGGAGAQALQVNTTAIGSNSSSQPSTCPAGGGGGAMALGGSYASGTDSFAAAIANNTSSYGATGANSIAMGDRAKADDSDSFAFGNLAISSGQASFAAGSSASALGNYSVALGFIVSAERTNSFALGFRAVANIDGVMSFSAGRFSSNGDAQTGTFVLRSDTTDATPEALTTTNGTATSVNQIILPNNSAFAFHGTIVARQQASGGTESAAWKVEGLIRREGSAGTTVLLNSATTILDNTPAWGMALSADTTNGGLKIEVTGAAATNIRWVATLNTSEVTY